MVDAQRILTAALAVAALAAFPPNSTEAAVPWRDRLGLAGVATPPVAPSSPVLALIDSPVDLGHPAFAAGSLAASMAVAPFDEHGTATAAIASATGAGGVLGVWPGMRVRSYPFTEDGATCEQTAERIARAVSDGAATISMSFGSEAPCFAMLAELQAATRRDVLLVAAAGNDRLFGNARQYPAAYPHVITVAALGDADLPAAFSGTGSAPDLAAPGTDVLTAVPPEFDPDATRDGWSRLSGTSFAAPMIAAGATWLRAVRPRLAAGQVAELLCGSARDIRPSGWDRRTGCGRLDLAAALRDPAPAVDPAEPNDDIRWVDGLVFGAATPAIWRGGTRRLVRASVTGRIDAADVYRILRPPHSLTRVTLEPQLGGADLRILGDGAVSSSDTSALIAASSRPHRSPDDLSISNRGSTSRIAYIVVSHDARDAAHHTDYRLRVARAGAGVSAR